jgi:hypothetical protein
MKLLGSWIPLRPSLAVLLSTWGIPSLLGAPPAGAQAGAPAWSRAHLREPMSEAEAREFMNRLARYVAANHLKRRQGSEQRGMVYEYFHAARKGEKDQFIQGEALDTMHDGAWLAAALVNASRASGDELYRELLGEWILPFYLKMLNHSDRLFTARHNHARPERRRLWSESKAWLFQEGEKGFVPYWWDDGGSVSLERRRDGGSALDYPGFDRFAHEGLPNPDHLLDGYSLGCSNHLAQDLGVMLQLAWLFYREGVSAGDAALASELAEAARNLQSSRMRHHGHIPMCDAPAALAGGDAALMRRLPDGGRAALWEPDNHYSRALHAFRPGQRHPLPGFADDQQYRYYTGIARHGGQVPEALAFSLIYDAFTEPLLYRYYSDDAPVPAGINRFDLHPYFALDGKLEDYRSDRKGPGGGPRPIGSRLGPQNMVVCGWALQLLRRYPGIWESRYRSRFAGDLRVFVGDPPPRSRKHLPPPAPAALELDGLALRLSSSRRALHIEGSSPKETAALEVFSGPGASGSRAIVKLEAAGACAAANGQGEALVVKCEVSPSGAGFEFRLELPYTVAKEQKPWANGIEHGRYSLRAGAAQRDFYLASSEEQVAAWLEHELAGGLRTWEGVFDELGYVPTGLGAGTALPGIPWEALSDSGGYAHLISAAAQWILLLQGKRDWELHRVPGV